MAPTGVGLGLLVAELELVLLVVGLTEVLELGEVVGVEVLENEGLGEELSMVVVTAMRDRWLVSPAYVVKTVTTPASTPQK